MLCFGALTAMDTGTEDRRNVNGNDVLGIDEIASTQPEFGASIPDGGYGWVILVASVFFQSLVPSLITGYGIFLLFSKLEHSTFSYPMLWDDNMVYTPLIFTAVWTAAEPWSRKLVTRSTWPRLVGSAGTCLICAGLLFMWIAVSTDTKLALFVLAGIFSGVGASILTSQTEILLAQYFRLKLSIVNDIIEAAVAVGFIVTPIVLGHNIVNHGVLRVLICYQTVILQGIIICLAFKKPSYLKARRRVYNYIAGNPDDEEDIFTKDMRELQNKMENPPQSTTVESNLPSTSQTTNNSNENANKKWVKFSEENSKQTLHESFAEDFKKDLKKMEFEDNFTDVPQPLFSESQVNNNVTYAYDLIEPENDVHEPTVFAPLPAVRRRSSLQQNIDYFRQPTFYKSLLTVITTKFSEFTFYTLFPSYLYVRVDSLKVHHATYLVGCLAIAGLCFTVVSVWINAHSKKRPIILWFFCWWGTCGYFLLSDTKNESFFLVGATQVILSISTLQYTGGPLLGLTVRGETNQRHRNLSILSGLAFSIFLLINFSYANCFRLMAILQFITGGVWMANFIYKKLKE